MRPLFFIIAVSCIPLSSSAEEIENQINKACLRHAVSLVSQLKSDVIGELNQSQSDQALKIATESCQAYFKKEFSQNSESIANSNDSKKQTADDDGVKDWLTEKILSGDSSRKEGNKRLDRLK